MSRPSTGDPRGRNKDSNTSHSVVVRIRPPCDEEQPIALWVAEDSKKHLFCGRGSVIEEYSFSRVFDNQDTNSTVFNCIHGHAIVDSVLCGFSETIFAYGQTSSGKTHTIFGSDQEAGLMQEFVHALFQAKEQSRGSRHLVELSTFEVLNDTLTDLMNLERFEGYCWDEELYLKTRKHSFSVAVVETVDQALPLLQASVRARRVGTSSLNLRSSRSHCIVRLTVKTVDESGVGEKAGFVGTLTLVDLAGSEKEFLNPTAEGRSTARVLNMSLASLNRLLRQLQEGRLTEADRRQGVLNRVLYDYLKPGCGICMIFCVNPELSTREASLSTLAMADASKSIRAVRKQQYLAIPSGKGASSTTEYVPLSQNGRSPRSQGLPQSLTGPSSPPLQRSASDRVLAEEIAGGGGRRPAVADATPRSGSTGSLAQGGRVPVAEAVPESRCALSEAWGEDTPARYRTPTVASGKSSTYGHSGSVEEFLRELQQKNQQLERRLLATKMKSRSRQEVQKNEIRRLEEELFALRRQLSARTAGPPVLGHNGAGVPVGWAPVYLPQGVQDGAPRPPAPFQMWAPVYQEQQAPLSAEEELKGAASTASMPSTNTGEEEQRAEGQRTVPAVPADVASVLAERDYWRSVAERMQSRWQSLRSTTPSGTSHMSSSARSDPGLEFEGVDTSDGDTDSEDLPHPFVTDPRTIESQPSPGADGTGSAAEASPQLAVDRSLLAGPRRRAAEGPARQVQSAVWNSATQ